MSTPNDHSELIETLGGNTAVSAGLKDCPPGRVQQWKRNGRIPPEYWAEIINLAKSHGLEFVCSDWMVDKLRPRVMPQSDAKDVEDAAA